ncbi:MAG TPA: hypothetical protein VHC49_18030 [Mycobacteriales bacterium]|nr:hypothetical protein [Mycobacteriales bacterium]
MPISDLTHDELHRIYGSWLPRRPRDAAALFAGYPGRWWIAGGWAIEAFTGISRPHGDLDPSIPRSELPLLRRHLAGKIDLWSADQETLRILLPGDDVALAESCENVWARSSGSEPWQYDIILMAVAGDRWVFKRDSRISLPVENIVRSIDGIPYLRPEIQLLHKAARSLPKNEADFAATWPLLEPADRRWLRDAIELAHPGHPWLEVL